MALTRNQQKTYFFLGIVLLGFGAYYLHKETQAQEKDIRRLERRLGSLQNEQRNAASTAKAIEKLDGLTIDARRATRLDVLRHLEIEDKGYKVDVKGSRATSVGKTKLYEQAFSIETEMTYAKSLQLADTLHSNPKVVLTSFLLKPGRAFGDSVKIKIEGVIYGLIKKGQS